MTYQPFFKIWVNWLCLPVHLYSTSRYLLLFKHDVCKFMASNVALFTSRAQALLPSHSPMTLMTSSLAGTSSWQSIVVTTVVPGQTCNTRRKVLTSYSVLMVPFFFFFFFFVLFLGATGTPVLDFWWRLLWVSKPEWVLPYSLFLRRRM